AGARHDLGTVIDDKRDVARLHRGGDLLGAFDQRAFAAVGKAQQHRGDVGGAECMFKLAGKECGITDRRGDQIKPRAWFRPVVHAPMLDSTSPRWGEVASQRVRSEVEGPMTSSASG